MSDYTIEQIIKTAETTWIHNKLPKSRMIEFMTTLKGYLSESGMQKDVCPKCLGTGKRVSN